MSATQPFPERVKIVEVGPRDGLQNEKVKIFLCLNQPSSKSSLSLSLCLNTSVLSLPTVNFGDSTQNLI